MGQFDIETISGVKVYVPTGAIETPSRKLAPRLNTVRGARIAMLDNCKEFADLVLRGVADVIARDFETGDIKFWRKGYPAKRAPFIKELAESCDAVINGVGH